MFLCCDFDDKLGENENDCNLVKKLIEEDKDDIFCEEWKFVLLWV